MKFRPLNITKDDVGKLFWIKHSDISTKIEIKSVREDVNGVLYLCGECNDGGWVKNSYGTIATLFNPKYYSMAGPIELPEELVKLRAGK